MGVRSLIDEGPNEGFYSDNQSSSGSRFAPCLPLSAFAAYAYQLLDTINFQLSDIAGIYLPSVTSMPDNIVSVGSFR